MCLVPFALVVGDTFGITGSLGANPIEEILDRFGNWGLRFIMITLAVTPLRQLTGMNLLARYRRMLGLFTFFYVFLHFVTWLILDQGLLMSAIVADIVKRPFITIGMVALLLLIALAVTSTHGMRRRLGRRWQTLHNSVYVIAVLGVWHFWWQVKLLRQATFTVCFSATRTFGRVMCRMPSLSSAWTLSASTSSGRATVLIRLP